MEVGAVAGLDGVGAGALMPRVAPLHETSLGDGGLRADAEALGHVFVRALVDRSDVLALRERVLEVCDDFGWLAPGVPIRRGLARPGARIGTYDEVWTEVQRRVVVLPEFAGLREHDGIVRILERVIGGPVVSGYGDVCRVFSPNAPELTTLPHQDGFYVRGRPGLWTAWIPLGDCPVELGGLAVLPGSHRHGLRAHAGEGPSRQGVDVAADEVWATADYRCGDVLLFHRLTLHRALENRSPDRLRVSADFRYGPAEAAEGVGKA